MHSSGQGNGLGDSLREVEGGCLHVEKNADCTAERRWQEEKKSIWCKSLVHVKFLFCLIKYG